MDENHGRSDMMDRQRYIVISEWMLDLGLNKSELIAYALIYGFCQDDDSDFHGSLKYVARWCDVDPRQATNILRSLVQKGLVVRAERPGQTSSYTIAREGGEINCRGEMDFVGGMKPIAGVGVKPISWDNKEIDIKEDIKDTRPSPCARELSTAYGEYVRMTPQEYDKLVERFGTLDASRLCEILDGYLAKKPNAYKSHYRAALGWPVQRLQEEKLTQQRLTNAKQAQQRIANPHQVPAGNYALGADADRRRKAIEDKYKN